MGCINFRERFKKEELENMHTKQLLKPSIRYSHVCSCFYSYNEECSKNCQYNRQTVKDILSGREHVMNKKESKEHRKQLKKRGK